MAMLFMAAISALIADGTQDKRNTMDKKNPAAAQQDLRIIYGCLTP
jgi:hypothetical protein